MWSYSLAKSRNQNDWNLKHFKLNKRQFNTNDRWLILILFLELIDLVNIIEINFNYNYIIDMFAIYLLFLFNLKYYTHFIIEMPLLF